MANDHPHTGPESSRRAVAGGGSASTGAAAHRPALPKRTSVGAALLLVFTAFTVIVVLLLFVILPIRDGKKARDSATETYRELHSMSYTAVWKIDGEISSVQTSMNGELSLLESGLWSLGLDAGSLAYDVGADSRPGVGELEDTIDARGDELSEIRHSFDARFNQLRDSVAARLGEFEDATGAAQDDNWDESRRRHSRNMRIVMVWMWSLLAFLLASGLAGLWMSWREYRAQAKPASGM